MVSCTEGSRDAGSGLMVARFRASSVKSVSLRVESLVSHVEMVDGIESGNCNHSGEPDDICELKGLAPTWRKKID